MSLSTEIRFLSDVVDVKTESNAKKLIRSLLSTFQDDLELSTGENVLTESLNRMNLDDQNSGMLTPINCDRSSASTPSLSLPDSFDVDCFNIVKDMKEVQLLADHQIIYFYMCLSFVSTNYLLARRNIRKGAYRTHPQRVTGVKGKTFDRRP